MKTYLLKTMGCKANFSDSHYLESELQKKGWTPQQDPESQIQLCLINSCTVTHEADLQTRRLAKQMAKKHPNAVIAVTGCGAEVNPEGLLQSEGVHYVIGNQNKNELIQLLSSKVNLLSKTQPEGLVVRPKEILGQVTEYSQMLSRHPMDREWPAVSSFHAPSERTETERMTDRTRVFFKIQEGCNAFCTYCIIPYGRGPSRSMPPEEVIQSIQTLVQQGTQEIILTGTNIGDYGNSPDAFTDLVKKIIQETEIARIRLSSLDPLEITEKMLKMMSEEPRLCPHFHISLQSQQDLILKRMKRKYQSFDVANCLQAISQLKVPEGGSPFVGMDLITGFPGETEAIFEAGFEALAELPWHRLHVFPYSERKNTPATRLSGTVLPHIRAKRVQRLLQLSFSKLTGFYEEKLKSLETERNKILKNVLLEKASSGKSPGKVWRAGYTPGYTRVLIPMHSENQFKRNQIITVRPKEVMLDSVAHDVALIADPVLSE